MKKERFPRAQRILSQPHAGQLAGHRVHGAHEGGAGCTHEHNVKGTGEWVDLAGERESLLERVQNETPVENLS